jgi:hypothetical protein
MDAGMFAEVEEFDGRSGQLPRGLQNTLTTEGEYGSVVVRIRVDIKQRSVRGLRQRVEHESVSPFADVDDAFEHGTYRKAGRAPKCEVVVFQMAARTPSRLFGAVERHLAPTTRDATTLALRGPTPNAVVDVVFHRVFEAGALYRAVCADLSSGVDADSIAREECLRREVSAAPCSHPVCFHYLHRPDFFKVVTMVISSAVQTHFTPDVEK